MASANPIDANAFGLVRAVTDSPDPDPRSVRVAAAAAEESSPAAALSSLERSLEILVNGLIGAYDLSANVAVQTHIAQVLARVGVERMEVPAGAAFDPSVYEAVSTVATADPQRYRRVAETLRPGWRRSDAVLRSPQVSVWVADPSGSGSAAGEPRMVVGDG